MSDSSSDSDSRENATTQQRGAFTTGLRWAWGHRILGPVLKAVAGYVVLVEGVVQFVLGRLQFLGLDVGLQARAIPRGIFLTGAVIGALYAFVAIGLILVYRANRVINFAQAQLGAVPAVLALLLVSTRGMPYVLAIVIVLVGGALVGGVVEVGVVRRFRDSSRLVLTVATIGVSLVLLVVEFLTKFAVTGGDILVDNFPTPFQSFSFELGAVAFYGDHLVTVLVAVAVIAGLAAFFRLTDIGIAVRAAAENRGRAALLGVPVDRVSTIVWMLAGLLSAVAVFLRGPLVGLPLAGFVGPIFLLYGLTAAVIARMERLSTALLAGMFIGIADIAAVFATSRSSLATAAMLVVIILALLVQRQGLARAAGTAGSAWQLVRELRPVPVQLRELTEVRAARGALAAGVVLFALALPWIAGDAKVNFATLGVIYAMVGVSLVVLTGWAGQISLGQFAISGVGAAVAGGLAANHNWDFFLTLAVAGLAGALVAVLVGLPALRIQGLFLAVTTLAFAFTVPNFFLRREFFPWLLPGDARFVRRPHLYGRLDMSTEGSFLGLTVTSDTKWYFLCLGFLGLTLFLGRSLRRYRSGRILIGARDNPRLVQAYGVSPASTRLAAFAISGFIAAIAGALLAYDQGAIDPQTYAPEQSVTLFVMTVLGGITSLTGAVLGALYLQAVPLFGLEDLPVVGDVFGALTIGITVLLVLYFVPGGLAEGLWRLRDRVLRRVAARHDIVVPALVADVRMTGDEDEDVLRTAREHTDKVAAGAGSGST